MTRKACQSKAVRSMSDASVGRIKSTISAQCSVLSHAPDGRKGKPGVRVKVKGQLGFDDKSKVRSNWNVVEVWKDEALERDLQPFGF